MLICVAVELSASTSGVGGVRGEPMNELRMPANILLNSGVAKAGPGRAHALPTRPGAPPTLIAQ